MEEAIALLGERFRDPGQDGPSACASFLAAPGDDEESAVPSRRTHRSMVMAPLLTAPDIAWDSIVSRGARPAAGRVVAPRPEPVGGPPLLAAARPKLITLCRAGSASSVSVFEHLSW